MVKKLRGLAPLLVIVIGLLVLFYPTISNFLVMKNASRVVSNYDAAVEALSDEEYRSMIDAAHAYNTRLVEENSGTTSALTGAVNTEATDAEYMKLLNLAGDGMMGYITVPRLKETMPIYHGTAEKVLQVGIGHLERTSLPVGGASTHAALSGHRGLPTAKLFTDLNLMKKRRPLLHQDPQRHLRLPGRPHHHGAADQHQGAHHRPGQGPGHAHHVHAVRRQHAPPARTSPPHPLHVSYGRRLQTHLPRRHPPAVPAAQPGPDRTARRMARGPTPTPSQHGHDAGRQPHT